ncbi:MAG: hypothetical protein JSR78_00530 [Proteobacteria bacterium]|nr:hypothetical protein [Pseudomonadota bacterium]
MLDDLECHCEQKTETPWSIHDGIKFWRLRTYLISGWGEAMVLAETEGFEPSIRL